MELSFAQDNNDNKDNKDNSDVSPTSTRNTRSTPTPTPTKSNSRTKADDATKDDNSATDDNKDDKENSDDNKDDKENSDEQTADENSGDHASSIDEAEMESEFPDIGTISITTPDAAPGVSAMFPIGGDVEIGWKISNTTWRPPKKITICGRLPPGYNRDTNPFSCDWKIATNISGSTVNVTWNTMTQGPPGLEFWESQGYYLYIFDSDLGRPANLKAGQAREAALKFSMYNSRYQLSNEGVPKGYNPSAAPPSVKVHMWGVVGVVALALLGVMA
ncbi:hypothetical protein EC988_006647 [Linderina pennispora]|nr:hypothetical protein EC988_006647 [Linderina pennispora]